MSYVNPFSLRLIEKKKKQLEIIAKKNSRSLNKQIEFIINQYIEDYERINGNIDVESK